MKNLTSTLMFFAVLICFSSLNASESLEEKFLPLQKIYFPKLDLRAPKSELKKLPEFAMQLDSLANEASLKYSSNTLNKNEKEIAGLILIYDAMFNTNVIIGIMQDQLNLADFTRTKHFAKLNATKNEELTARAQHLIAELEMAAKLRPNDHRIDSWLAGAKIQGDKIETGHLSKNAKLALIKAISVRPSFNLWTAILSLHTQPAATNQPLLKAAEDFVKAADQGKDPCTLHPADCVSTWKAPYNIQASVTELGDVFLQQAEYFLKKGYIAKSMELASYAEGTYAQLNKPAHIQQTKAWPDHDALMMRHETLISIQKQNLPKIPFTLNKDYQRVYECASCHGRYK